MPGGESPVTSRPERAAQPPGLRAPFLAPVSPSLPSARSPPVDLHNGLTCFWAPTPWLPALTHNLSKSQEGKPRPRSLPEKPIGQHARARTRVQTKQTMPDPRRNEFAPHPPAVQPLERNPGWGPTGETVVSFQLQTFLSADAQCDALRSDGD